LGTALGHGGEPIAQIVELGVDRLLGRQLLVGVPLAVDQLAADLGGTDPGEEAVGLELGVGLTVPVGDLPDVVEQAGEPLLGPLAAAAREGIDAGHAAVQLVGPLADGAPSPAQVLLGPALPAPAHRPDGLGHVQPPSGAFEFLGGVDEHGDHLGGRRDHRRFS
jgi:hypothetical protein